MRWFVHAISSRTALSHVWQRKNRGGVATLQPRRSIARLMAVASARKDGRRCLGRLAVLCIAVAVTTGCADGAPDIELPARWVDMPTGRSSAVEFRPDGTGTFTEFPLWSGESCNLDDASPYSGDFRWHAVDGYFQVDAPNGPMRFQPTAHMGEDDWGKLMVSVCGENTPSDALLRYLEAALDD